MGLTKQNTGERRVTFEDPKDMSVITAPGLHRQVLPESFTEYISFS